MVVLRALATREGKRSGPTTGRLLCWIEKRRGSTSSSEIKRADASLKDFTFRALSVDKHWPVWNSLMRR